MRHHGTATTSVDSTGSGWGRRGDECGDLAGDPIGEASGEGSIGLNEEPWSGRGAEDAW